VRLRPQRSVKIDERRCRLRGRFDGGLIDALDSRHNRFLETVRIEPLALLQLGQLGLATHVHPSFAGSSSPVVGTLHDPLPFVLGQGAQEGDEAMAD